MEQSAWPTSPCNLGKGWERWKLCGGSKGNGAGQRFARISPCCVSVIVRAGKVLLYGDTIPAGTRSSLLSVALQRTSEVSLGTLTWCLLNLSSDWGVSSKLFFIQLLSSAAALNPKLYDEKNNDCALKFTWWWFQKLCNRRRNLGRSLLCSGLSKPGDFSCSSCVFPSRRDNHCCWDRFSSSALLCSMHKGCCTSPIQQHVALGLIQQEAPRLNFSACTAIPCPQGKVQQQRQKHPVKHVLSYG